MWPREPAAHVARGRQEILVLVFKALLLGFAHEGRPLVRQDLVVPSENEVNVVFKLREKAFETRR
jgi:hypothetical protein